MFRPCRSRLFRTALFLPLLLVAVACPRSSSHRISGNGTEAFEPRVALDGFGYGTVVFVDALTDDDFELGIGVLNVIPFDPVAGFGAPVVFFEDQSFDPHVVHDPYDGVRIVWCENVNETGNENARFGHVLSARQTIDGTWQPLVQLDGGLAERGTLGLESDGFGRAIAAWGRAGAVWASVAPAGGDFGPPVALAPLADALSVGAAAFDVNGNGLAVLVALSSLAGGGQEITVYQGDVAHGVGAPEGIATTAICGPPAVVLSNDGTIVAAWQHLLPDGSVELATRRNHPATGWDPIETILTPSDLPSRRVALAVDAAGVVTMAWEQNDPSDVVAPNLLRVARAAADGPFGVPFDPNVAVTEVTRVVPQNFDLAVDPATAGVTLVGISGSGPLPFDDLREEGFGLRFQAATETWSALRELDETPTPVAEPARGIDVAADASGIAIAVWVRDGSVNAFTWRTPVPGFVTRPDPPLAGQTTMFDASSSRAKSDDALLTAFEWDLDDDGLFETGGEFVEKTFALAGSYPVTLRITDDWGDVATHARTIAVQDGGGGGGPPWKLLVLKSGGGTGYVSSDLDSDGDGTPDIDCGSDCEEFYADGPAPDDHAQVYLLPIADPGSVFSHWEGLDGPTYFDGDYGVEGCLVQMVANRTITAVFEPLVP